MPVHVIEAAQAYALFLHDKRGSCPTLHAKKFPALKMDRNGDGLGPIPLPWELLFLILPSFQQILSCLLLHPTSWDRRKHFRGIACGDACGCCRSRWLLAPAGEGCAICLQAWVLTTISKNMMQSVQMHNATCSCLTCSKSWMDKGWVCLQNPWRAIIAYDDMHFPRRGSQHLTIAYDSPFLGGWSDDSDDQSLEESPHAANAPPESQETHSPRSSISSPRTIYPRWPRWSHHRIPSQDGLEGACSLDGGEGQEEQQEEVPELA